MTSETLHSEHFKLVEAMPKVELHAHLNGCIRETTLFDLAKDRGVKLCEHLFSETPVSAQDHSMYNVRPRSLQDCFDMFAQIPKCVNDLAALERITTEALEDFAQHHVAYLELRSTPKKLFVNVNDSSGGTNALADKTAYCDTILRCMKEFEQQENERYNREIATGLESSRLPMVCRSIVAVDRASSTEEALEHVDLAVALKSTHRDSVVGVDLGGNPTKNHFNHFRSAFAKARDAGLKVTLHCAEVPCDENDSEVTNTAYEEAQAILNFCPDRLGHALLLPPSLQKQLSDSRIPVESCPTSNVMTLELAKHYSGSLLEGLKKHPQLKTWLETKHPISIGTDDPGVFHTTPTKELLLVQEAFGLGNTELQRIVIDSLNQAFCDDATKHRVLERFERRMATLPK